MTVSEIDIWRSANELIKQYGADASIHAAMKTDELLAKGDLDGAAVWRRIVRAVEDLQADKPSKDGFRH